MCKDNTIVWFAILIYIMFSCKNSNSNNIVGPNEILEFSSGLPI
ncbi:MAG: hypothetical protein RR922_06950 [Clostridia bacterium]